MMGRRRNKGRTIMEIKDYIEQLTDEDKLHIFFIQDRGKIVKFAVQYYAKIGGRWRTIMRADNAHGVPHYHFYYLHAPEYRVELLEDANAAFTRARQEIRDNRQAIKAISCFPHEKNDTIFHQEKY